MWPIVNRGLLQTLKCGLVELRASKVREQQDRATRFSREMSGEQARQLDHFSSCAVGNIYQQDRLTFVGDKANSFFHTSLPGRRNRKRDLLGGSLDPATSSCLSYPSC